MGWVHHTHARPRTRLLLRLATPQQLCEVLGFGKRRPTRRNTVSVSVSMVFYRLWLTSSPYPTTPGTLLLSVRGCLFNSQLTKSWPCPYPRPGDAPFSPQLGFPILREGVDNIDIIFQKKQQILHICFQMIQHFI